MLSNSFKRYLLNFALFKWMQSFKRFMCPVENHGSNNNIICDCKTSKRMDYHISVTGNNNVVKIAPSCQLYDMNIVINGDNNVLELDDEVKIQKGIIKVFGGAKFHIGHNSTFQELDANVTKEDVIIGDDCLFSYGIVIRNYDGHKIIDVNTNEICNPPGKITLRDHVWVSQNVTILKDVEIGENAIVGVGAVVTKSIPSNCIAAGVPAKVIKENRNWIRH